MRMPPVQLAWTKPLPFWSLFPAPFASTIAAWVIDQPHRGYYAASFFCAFLTLLSLIESLASGRIEDTWATIERKTHPVRYWVQIWLWIATYLCATAFPITFALFKNHR